ncbi:MAG: integrase arm-type DNA-binding domain-containing protein, partial [Desulfarculus sp.]|nr:integrase arm-type DNA-binding domain-containing protein [Pseudomonadota bacterium]MBV1753619.1 integrase arm-type DNA-binding domain-containing protein [Desulfarculus sp.]
MAKLTKRFIDSLRPRERDFVVWDADMPGFGIRVKPSGRKSFVVQYRNAQGRSRRLTVGVYGHLTPAEARKEARLHLADADRGMDPAETRTEARKASTVAEFAQRYLLEHARPKKKPLSVAKDEQLLRLYILPALGTHKIDAITKRDVARLIHSMIAVPIQANRVLS